MTSKIYFQDDSIQLIEIAPENGSTEHINRVQSPSALTKFKKKNKVQSPTIQSPNLSLSSSSKISDVFIVKQNTDTKTVDKQPIPAPRKLKAENTPQSSQTISRDSPKKLRTRIKKLSETTESASPSGDVQSLFSLKSDTLSYKERLRNRFLSVKKQAEHSVIQSDNKSQTSRKKKFVEVTEEVLEKENSVINAELRKYEKNKSKDDNEENISAYDFFCNDGENKSQNEQLVSSEKKDKARSTTSPPDPDADENSNSSRQSLNEFLGIDNLEMDVVDFLCPEILDIPAYEKDAFKSYKRFKYKKNDIEFEPRHLEEEGIFKSDNSHISKRQLFILEERLSSEGNQDWFGSDGQLKILPDPRLNSYFRPFSSNVSHNDFVNKYVPPTLYEPMENTINIIDNTLDINLNDITFHHHPLFSTEHVLSQKLLLLYEEHKQITSSNSYFMFNKKLEALRCAKNRLINTIKASGENNETQVCRIAKYGKEIKEIREKMYAEGLKERMLKKQILFIWKTLKNIRSKQKYSNTTIKLIITKEYNNYENEVKAWEKNIEEETLEILEEYEKSFEIEMKNYKSELKEWKLQRKNLNIEENESDVYEMIGERPKKPKRHFDEEQIKMDILEKCNESLKPPGEPIIEFDLVYDETQTQESDNPKEKLRRNAVNKTQIFAKILYNKREICRSRCISLNNKFICSFNENISVKIFKIPHSLNMEIYEQTNTITKRLLAEICLSIPDFEITVQDSDSKQESFINKEIVNFNHTAVGTGTTLDDIFKLEDFEFEGKHDQLFCSGTVSYNIVWSTDNMKVLTNNSKHVDSPNLVPTLFDIENLEEWIKNYPDPQDPQNALFFDYIKSLESKTDTEKNYFRFDPDMKPFEFCDDSKITENPRFKLLKLRQDNEPEFRGLVVPNRVKEISPDIFASYEKRLKEEKMTVDISVNEFQEDSIDAQRKWANKYLEQAENRIIQLSKIAERKITLKDVLNEELIPSISSLGLSFMNWLQPKRPLRPVRKPAKKIQTAVTIKELNIMVNIIGALQVPTRSDSDTISSSTRTADHISVAAVRPFVVASFQDASIRTTVAEGPSPIWNQELILPLRNKNENMTISSLQNIKDSLILNLYDETVDDLIVDERIRDTNIHQQLGCNWLGRIEIPFTTLLYNNRVEGTFKLNLPPILLGYERQSIKVFQTTGEPFTQKIDTFLTVFITLQPSVGCIQQNINNDLECNELQYIDEYVTNWQNQFNLLHPQRNFSSFVTNMNGERCCLTRYLKPVKLPQFDSETSEITAQQCARYVSLIPFRENSASGLIPDIWLTAEELLTLMMGSIRDHVVLLTCYFMTLGIKTWLLLGYGMPHGNTAYVLTKENDSLGNVYNIYDVKTGLKYDVYDNNCSLQRVFCVINDENIWGNIQCEDRLHLTKFDFTKSSDWLPLFNRDVSAPTSTFHHTNIVYNEITSVAYLQERIDKKLRKKIMKWRKFSRTIWNHYCNVTFKKILQRLEENSMEYTDYVNSPEHTSELQHLLASYQIRGFAMSFPYTTVTDLINFVQATGIHLNENPNIEFSLAVYVHSYVNNAVVIWLYLATLVRRR